MHLLELINYCSLNNIIKIMLLNNYHNKKTNINFIETNEKFLKEIYNKKIITTNKIIDNWNNKLFNMNHMYKLQELVCKDSLINQNGIKKLSNIIKLNCHNNEHIYNVNHLTKLKKLNTMLFSTVNQEGIRKLTKIKILKCYDHKNITNVNHMKNLKGLHIQGYDCGINQKGIIKLTGINVLNAYTNNKITNISHIKNLKIYNYQSTKYLKKKY